MRSFLPELCVRPAAVWWLKLRGAVIYWVPLSLMLWAPPVIALDFFAISGRHSFHALVGIPRPPLAARAGGAGWLLSVNHANMFAGGTTQNEYLLLDGERTELRLNMWRPFGACFLTGFDWSVIGHQSGVFDQSIETWHRWFGLPDADRASTKPDSLDINYGTQAKRQRVSSDVHGVGDLLLSLSGKHKCAATHSWRWRIGLLLPVGDETRLTGRGAVDVSADMTSGTWQLGDSLQARASVGVVVPGSSDFVPNTRSAAMYGSFALAWPLLDGITLQGQLDWHSVLYNSKLTELGRSSTLLTIGAGVRTGPRQRLEFGFLEDTTPDTAPDVGLYIAYRYNM